MMLEQESSTGKKEKMNLDTQPSQKSCKIDQRPNCKTQNYKTRR